MAINYDELVRDLKPQKTSPNNIDYSGLFQGLHQGEEEGLLDFLGRNIKIGTASMIENASKIVENGMRPESLTPSQWEQAYKFHDTHKAIEDWANRVVSENQRQYNPDTEAFKYYGSAVLQSAPESIATMAAAAAAGSKFGGLFGAGANGLRSFLSSALGRNIYNAISQAYNGTSTAAKIARQITPNANTVAATGFGSHLEALSEAQRAKDEYIEDAKRNGSYVPDLSELEGDKIKNKVYRDNIGIITGANAAEYNMMLGKHGGGLKNRLGRLIASMGMEGGEEAAQEYATMSELKKPIDSSRIKDAAITGAIMGGGMNVIGQAAAYPGERREAREQAERNKQDAENEIKYRKLYNDLITKADDELFTNALNVGQTQTSKSLRNWTNRITDGKMSDEVHDLIVKAAEKNGVDRKLALSLAMAESNGNQNEVSEAGAIGVMQLMPETARSLGVNPYDVEQNIEGGIRYLKQQLDAVGGDWRKAAAAYNAGLGNVQKYGGIPPFGETQAYVKRIGEYLNESPDDEGGQIQKQDIDLKAIAKQYIGQRMPNGELGCVDAVVRIGSGYNDFLKEQYDKNVAYVPTLIENAQKAGVEVIPFDANRLEKGDVIVYDGRETDQHVMIYDGNGGVIGNSTSRQQVVTQNSYDYAPKQLTPSRIIKTGVGNNINEEKQQTSKVNTKPKYEGESNNKNGMEKQQLDPLFDITANDSATSDMLQSFIDSWNNTATGQDAANAANVFDSVTDRQGRFIDTPENRQIILDNYSDELNAFANGFTNEKEAVLAAADNLIAKKRDAGDFSYQEVESAKQAGDIAALKKMLQQNKVKVPKIEAKTPNLDNAKKQQRVNTVEGIMKNAQLLSKGLLKALEVAQEPVSDKASRRVVQGKAQMVVAKELGIKLDEALKNALYEGKTKAITKAQEQLKKIGAFELNRSEALDYARINREEEAKRAREKEYADEQEAILNREIGKETQNRQAIVNIVNGYKKKKEKEEFVEEFKRDVTKEFDLEYQKEQEKQKEADEKYKNILNRLKEEGEEIQTIEGKETEEAITESERELAGLAKTRGQLVEGMGEVKGGENNRRERLKQGEALLEAIKSPYINQFVDKKFKLPEGLNEAIKKGYAGGIKKAQEILKEAGLTIGAENKPQRKQRITGNVTKLETDNGNNLQTRYQVVEADDIVSSDNELYPQELQPRDRDRALMREQTSNMSNNLKPVKLMESNNVNEGAPVIRGDGVVLNGNGRVIGIRGAYEIGKADNYKQALIENADRLGIDKTAIEKMKQPILVRAVTHSLDDREKKEVIESTAGGARMGASEQAKIDAGKLTNEVLKNYIENENGDYTTAANREFVSGIIGKIVGKNDVNAYTDKRGEINADGISRVKRAVFAKAYEDDGLISKMTESTDDNIRNVSNGLMNAAAKMASIQIQMDEGSLHKYDIAKNISGAVKRLSALREQGIPVDEYMKQQSMFDEYADTEEMREILSFIEKNKRSARKISSFLNEIADKIKAQGNPNQTSLFEGVKPTELLDIIKSARNKVETGGEQNLFADSEEQQKRNAEAVKVLERAENDESYISVEENIKNGKKAIKKVLETQEDVKAAMQREDIGDIDFVYGTPGKGAKFKKGYGLSHIVAKRNAENGKGIETANKLVEVIARGTETDKQSSDNGGEYRLRIHYDGYTAVLSSSTGERNAWLLTGWEDNNKSTSNANGEGNDSTAATTATPTLTRRNEETDTSDKNITQKEEKNNNEDNETAFEVDENYEQPDEVKKQKLFEVGSNEKGYPTAKPNDKVRQEIIDKIDDMVEGYEGTKQADGSYKFKYPEDRDGFVMDAIDVIKTEKLKAGREKAKAAQAKWSDEKLDEVVANNPELVEAVKQFHGTTVDGHVQFAKKKDRKNFIKHLENLEKEEAAFFESVKGTSISQRNNLAKVIREMLEKSGITIKTSEFGKGNLEFTTIGYATPEKNLISIDFDHIDTMLSIQTPMHEYTHIWSAIVRRKNPKLWKHGVKLMKTTKKWEQVKRDYGGLDYTEEEDGLASEVLAHLVEEAGWDLAGRISAKTENKEGIIEGLKRWVQQYWREVKDFMRPWTTEETQKMTLKDFVAAPLTDLIRETNIGRINNTSIYKHKSKSGRIGFTSPQIDNAIIENRELQDNLKEYGAEWVPYNNAAYFPSEKSLEAFRKKYILDTKYSLREKKNKPTVENFVDPKDLTEQQRGIAEIGDDLGVPVIYFKDEKNLNGAHANGITYINVDSPVNPKWIFWHEAGHWLKANHPALMQEVIDKLEINQAQIDDFRERTKRYDLNDDEVREEIFADNMFDADKRLDILQKLGKKDVPLVQKLVSWLKSVLDKVTSFFNTPKYGLTNTQKHLMYDELGKAIRKIRDANDNKIFRYGNTTRVMQLIDGSELPHMDIVYSFAGTKALTANKKGKWLTNPYQARKDAEKIIDALRKETFVNKATGIKATISKKGVGKLISDKAIGKSIDNGYDEIQHIEAAKNIKQLFEDAELVETRDDRNKEQDVISIKYFHCDTEVLDDKAVARIMVKETIEHGHKLYTIELQQLNKPTGLSNRNGTNFPVSSKGSTQNSHIADSRDAEEPFKNNISQNNDKSNIKYSIGSNEDNSNESYWHKVKNYFTKRNELNERQKKKMTRLLMELSGYKIGYAHTNKDLEVKDAEKVIRTRKAYDFERILPVVGRLTAQQLNLEATPEMSNYIADWILTGVVSNRSAEAQAFEKAMRDNPEIGDKLLAIRESMQDELNMTPLQLTKSAIKSEETKKSFAQVVGVARKKFDEEWRDDLSPIKRLVEDIEKATGQKVPDNINAYLESRMYKGTDDVVYRNMIEAGSKEIENAVAALQARFPTVDFTGFKPLAAIIEEAGGHKALDDFTAYVTAKHIKDIHEHNRKNPDEYMETRLSEATCDAVIEQFKNKFDQAQKDLVRFSKVQLEMLYRSGLLSEKNYNELKNKWPNYVPLHRVFDENEDLNTADSMKRMKGSRRDVFNPIQEIHKNTFDFVRRAEKNRIKCLLANLSRCGGVGTFIEEVDKKQPDLRKTITFYENGKKKYLEIADEDVVRAINSIDNRIQGMWIMKMIRAATGVVRSLLTALNVDFAAGNIFRDAPDAYINNKYGKKNPITMFCYIYKGLMSAIHKDKVFYEWLAFGGGQATFISEDRDRLKTSLDEISKTRTERWFKSGVTGFFSQVLNGMQLMSEYSEYATRIGVYQMTKDTLAKQNSDKQANWSDKRKAAYVSRDTTIDFARAGHSAREANRYFAFSNAAIQGIDRFCRTFDWKKLKTEQGKNELAGAIFRMAVASIIPTIACFLLNHDKDWYKNLPDWQKDNNWILGEGIKIPKGMDLGLRLSSNLTEHFLSWTLDNKPFEFFRAIKPLKDSLPYISSYGMPTLLTPIAELASNYSFFREAPIVPLRMQKLPAHMQRDAYSSWLAKHISDVTGFSPKNIDHFISSYFGFMGRLFSGGVDMTLETAPMTRRFIFDPYKNPQNVKEYYEKYKKQSELYEEYKVTKKKPDDFDPTLFAKFKAAKKTMTSLSKLENSIINDTKLDIGERRKKLRKLEEKRMAFVDKVLKGR